MLSVMDVLNVYRELCYCTRARSRNARIAVILYVTG